MLTFDLLTKITFIQLVRYFLFAGVLYLVIQKWGKKFFARFFIQTSPISKQQINHEIKNSLVTSIIFGVIFTLVVHPALRPYNQIYTEADKYSAWWSLVSLILLIIINDTYFYWMHRLVHHKRFYRWIHHTHHVSTNPTPLTSYSFHPIEAVLEAIWILPVIYLIPIKLEVLIIYSLVSLVNNLRGHYGVDLLPKKIKQTFPLNWINTATHHSHHHKYFTHNFGLYFLFWDRVCGTEKPELGTPYLFESRRPTGPK